MLNINTIVELENVHCKMDNTGTIWYLIDDIARELGFTFESTKNIRAISGTNEDNIITNYSSQSIRWNRINNYLAYYNISPVKSGDYVNEQTVSALAIKANNEKARQFQLKLIYIIIPYFKNNVNLNQYNEMIVTCNELQQQNQKLQNDNIKLYNDNVILNRDFNNFRYYHNHYINPNNAYHATMIAKDYGLSAYEFHNLLKFLHVIHPVDGTIAINQRYTNLDYTKYINEIGGKVSLGWTERGREFLFNFLSRYNILPGQENKYIISNLYKELKN